MVGLDEWLHTWLLASAALIYSTVRFVEAYGLWRNRSWAEWFAVVSAGLYVPVELYELSHGVSCPKICVLALNLIIVTYLGYVLLWAKSKAVVTP